MLTKSKKIVEVTFEEDEAKEMVQSIDAAFVNMSRIENPTDAGEALNTLMALKASLITALK